MRSLLLATAGHVNHGKSTLIERLTGLHPDRLPQEKARGMTLDLGFGHTAEFSFVDCPGHESLTRHMIAGQNGVDGALFVVAYNEGLQEQSREHARILSWLGVNRILLVITKCDLAASDEEMTSRHKKILGDTRELFRSHQHQSDETQHHHKIELSSDVASSTIVDSVLFSPQIGVDVLRAKIQSFFAFSSHVREYIYNRFLIDRSFTVNGIGTVVTGTHTEGALKKGDHALLWFANGKKPREVVVKSLRRHNETLSESRDVGRVALVLDDVHPKEIIRGSQLLIPGRVRSGEAGAPQDLPELATNLALAIQWALPVKKQFTATLQSGTLSHEVSLRLHPKGFWRCRTKFPLPLRRGDRVIIRIPQRVKNIGQSVGGGLILDAYAEKVTADFQPPAASQTARWRDLFKETPRETAFALKAGLPLDEAHQLYDELFLAPVREAQKVDRARSSQLNDSASDADQTGSPASPALTPGETALLEKVRSNRWSAFVEKSNLHVAHGLAKKGQLHHVRDEHFLHAEQYDELLTWLNRHFVTCDELTVDHAREFFQTGRKTFLEILEFCDRLGFTFRKDNARKKFRLPSSPRPSSCQPSYEHAGATLSDRRPDLC